MDFFAIAAMADGYWSRQPPPHPAAKRPRPDSDFLPPGAPYGQETRQYLPRDDDRASYHAAKDTKSIEASYERYLQNAQLASGSGGATNYTGAASGRAVGGLPDPTWGMRNAPYRDSVTMSGPGLGAVGGDMLAYGRGTGFDSQRPLDHMVRPGPHGQELPLPPDASNTLFVEGLPLDSTEREVAHIFRPFMGYKEVRLVTKEPKYHSGDPLVLCFVDFTTAACVATALNALQGYKMDVHDPNSPELRLQFARYPASKSSHGSRGKRDKFHTLSFG